MAFNPMLFLCLFLVITKVVIPSGARELKTTASPDEKEVMIHNGNNDGHEAAPMPCKNINMEKKYQEVGENQFPPMFPFPYTFPLPFPPIIPGLPWPTNPPPLDIPGVNPFPFPTFPPGKIPTSTVSSLHVSSPPTNT